MDFKVVATVLVAVFIAELGDKTQLATMLFTADRDVSLSLLSVGLSFLEYYG